MDRLLKYNNPNINGNSKNAKLSYKEKDEKENGNPKVKTLYHTHPYAALIRGNHPQLHDFKKFVTIFYKGLNYSLNNLKGPSEEFIKKKSVTLPEHKQLTRQKFLILDLDETLIHSVFNNAQSDVTFQHQGSQFKFNIRPYCLQFLQNLTQYFSIYIFTASTVDYATPIVDYLNKKKKTIQGILHRKNCMETNHGFFIKDLRIIKNRTINEMVIVDNLVHSFGLQIQNGIPILDFTDNKNDKELIGLQPFLIQLSSADKVPQFLRNNLKLSKLLNHKEDQIMKIFDKNNP